MKGQWHMKQLPEMTKHYMNPTIELYPHCPYSEVILNENVQTYESEVKNPTRNL